MSVTSCLPMELPRKSVTVSENLYVFESVIAPKPSLGTRTFCSPCCLLSSRSRSAFREVPATEQPLPFPNGRQASEDVSHLVGVRARVRVGVGVGVRVRVGVGVRARVGVRVGVKVKVRVRVRASG